MTSVKEGYSLDFIFVNGLRSCIQDKTLHCVALRSAPLILKPFVQQHKHTPHQPKPVPFLINHPLAFYTLFHLFFN